MNEPLLRTLWNRFATGAATAGATPGKTTPAENALTGNSAICPRLRSQVHLFAHRLQPENDRHAGRRGVAQLAKLDGFIKARKRNFQALSEGLRGLEEFFVLPEPTPGSDPSWFGFPIAVRPEAPFSRNEATRYLEERNIATRSCSAATW